MLTISSGHSADYLLGAVAEGRESYYTGAVLAGEPAGRWYGTGADALGLSGLVDHQDMRALYERFIDPRDPGFRDKAGWGEAATLGHTGRKYLSAEQIYEASLTAEPHADAERRDQLLVAAGKKARNNVAFLDATFSVQKSVTVLHTSFEAQEVTARNAGEHEAAKAWAAHRQAVEDAIWSGNNAMLDFLADKAGYSRIGHHGGAAGRYIDAHGLTVASFFQHDSRDRDPQLHIHNAILNRVQGTDGIWRTLDGRSLYAWRAAAAAVAERVTEEHLTRSLGVGFATRPDGKAREIVGIGQPVMDLFSSRRRAIGPKAAQLMADFEAKVGRVANALERDRLLRTATFATRKSKDKHGETNEARLARWDRQLRAEVAGGLASVAQGVLKLAQKARPVERWSPTEVLETALAAVQAKRSAWTASDLTREINTALPDRLGITDPADVARLLDGLTAEGLKMAVALDAVKPGDELLPAEFRLADGSSAFDAPGVARYATPEHLHTERLLVAATLTRDARAAATDAAATYLDGLREGDIRLGADQAAAIAGVLTSGARVESLVGPAGTGKSFVVGMLTRGWQDPALWPDGPGRVFGLATSQIAAEVLTGEGVTASNTARWLAAQDRLSTGRAAARDEQWRLSAGDLVVVDESSMADTAALAAIHRHVVDAGAKMLLVGDHRQLGAVGAGGGMDLLAGAGRTYELTEARRFHQRWERDASLRLRAGDTGALEDYHRNGRIVDGGAIEQTEYTASRRWLGDTLAGKHALLVVDTNEQAGRINADLRAELIRIGKVTEAGVPLGRDGTHAGVGDVVQTRLNGWHLAGHAGNQRGPINREQHRVLSTAADGSILVAPIVVTAGSRGGERLGRPMCLPAAYVSEHVTLGYAVTAHAAEGLTVDTGHTITTAGTRAQSLYPSSTRGRESNTIYVVTQAPPAKDAATGETAQAARTNPRAVLEQILETSEAELSATATAAESAADAVDVRMPAERLAVAAEHAAAQRTAGWLDDLVAVGQLTAGERARIAAEDGTGKLGPILRRAELAGHDAKAVLSQAVTQRTLGGAQQISNVLYSRIADAHTFDPQGDRYGDRVPRVDDPAWQAYLDALAEAADNRLDELGRQAVTLPPTWALEAFGDVPDGGPERADWIDRAGLVAGQRELSGHDDPAVALGPAPKPGQPEAHAAWRAAWRALGRPEVDADELQMSDGRLRLRVRAYEREQTWAPRLVTNELAGTIQAAEHHRAVAARRAAEAAAVTDPTDSARLRRAAADAAALADTLDTQTAHLRDLDQARGHWLVHTAGTRAAYDRARLELASRHAGDPHADHPVTAHEWLTAHDETMRAEDEYRPVTDETDLTDQAAEREADLQAAAQQDTDAAKEAAAADTAAPGDPARQPVPRDLREIAADEPAPADEHIVRVPTAQETADAVQRAQRALDEIAERDATDTARAAEEARADQLNRWHADDTATEQAAHQDAADQAAYSR